MADDPGDWTIIHRSTSHTDSRERTLVLHAAGIRHEVRLEAGGFAIVVASADAERGRAELDAYTRENRERRATLHAAAPPFRGWGGVLAFAAVLVVAALLRQRHSLGVDWLEAGRAHAGLIRGGQWWRVVTALTLHTDLAHLLANVVIGGLVGLFAGQSLGSGLAWFGILIGGASGNLLNACLRPADHSSVGASTAVFAAVGLQAALAWRRRRSPATSRMERWVPLVGGVLLLSFLGTGGVRTDVAAHVCGFVCGGLAGGLVGRRIDGVWSRRLVQALLGAAALAILAGSWMLALMPHPPVLQARP